MHEIIKIKAADLKFSGQKILCTRQKIKCSTFVVPAKAGIHAGISIMPHQKWIPAFAGKTLSFLSCTKQKIIQFFSCFSIQRSIKPTVLLLVMFYQMPLMASGLFFNVSTKGRSLIISTTIAQHVYPPAGIKINTAGYVLNKIGTDCIDGGNGYCLFTVSNTTSRVISIKGGAGTVSLSLCLDGNGPISCQNYKVTLPAIQPYAYVPNFKNGNTSTVSICPIKPDGGFGACVDASNVFDGPTGIVLNSSGNIAYVSNYSLNGVKKCIINDDGSFGACTDSGSSGLSFNGPMGIVLNGTGRIAYVANNPGNFISKCSINANGTWGACVDSGNSGESFSGPTGITLNKAGDLAYIANHDGNAVIICPINPDGTFGFCQDSSYPISFKSKGKFAVCFLAPGTFSGPNGVILNGTENFAYVTNYNNGLVNLCRIQPDGSFGTCVDLVALNGPVGIVLNGTGALAYITEYNSNSVTKCSVNIDGTFGICDDSGSTGVSFNNPFFIALTPTVPPQAPLLPAN